MAKEWTHMLQSEAGNQCNFVLILRHEQNNAVAGWFNRSSIFAQWSLLSIKAESSRIV
jgi:hypothetical protein